MTPFCARESPTILEPFNFQGARLHAESCLGTLRAKRARESDHVSMNACPVWPTREKCLRQRANSTVMRLPMVLRVLTFVILLNTVALAQDKSLAGFEEYPAPGRFFWQACRRGYRRRTREALSNPNSIRCQGGSQLRRLLYCRNLGVWIWWSVVRRGRCSHGPGLVYSQSCQRQHRALPRRRLSAISNQ